MRKCILKVKQQSWNVSFVFALFLECMLTWSMSYIATFLFFCLYFFTFHCGGIRTSINIYVYICFAVNVLTNIRVYLCCAKEKIMYRDVNIYKYKMCKWNALFFEECGLFLWTPIKKWNAHRSLKYILKLNITENWAALWVKLNKPTVLANRALYWIYRAVVFKPLACVYIFINQACLPNNQIHKITIFHD